MALIHRSLSEVVLLPSKYLGFLGPVDTDDGPAKSGIPGLIRGQRGTGRPGCRRLTPSHWFAGSVLWHQATGCGTWGTGTLAAARTADVIARTVFCERFALSCGGTVETFLDQIDHGGNNLWVNARGSNTLISQALLVGGFLGFDIQIPPDFHVVG